MQKYKQNDKQLIFVLFNLASKFSFISNPHTRTQRKVERIASLHSNHTAAFAKNVTKTRKGHFHELWPRREQELIDKGHYKRQWLV